MDSEIKRNRRLFFFGLFSFFAIMIAIFMFTGQEVSSYPADVIRYIC